MKFAIGVLAGIWLLCGIVGAAWQDNLDGDHWRDIAKGPITLINAYNEDPPQSPSPV